MIRLYVALLVKYCRSPKLPKHTESSHTVHSMCSSWCKNNESTVLYLETIRMLKGANRRTSWNRCMWYLRQRSSGRKRRNMALKDNQLLVKWSCTALYMRWTKGVYRNMCLVYIYLCVCLSQDIYLSSIFLIFLCVFIQQSACLCLVYSYTRSKLAVCHNTSPCQSASVTHAGLWMACWQWETLPLANMKKTKHTRTHTHTPEANNVYLYAVLLE